MTFDDVAEKLMVMSYESSEAAHAHAAEFARELGHPPTVRAIFHSILDNELLLAKVARHSFHHSNHFDKLVLLGEETGGAFRLVLNLWRPPYSTDEVTDDQIHDHRCDFWSTILFGSLRAAEFQRNDAGEPYTELRYRAVRSVTGAKRNEYRMVGLSRLRHTGDIERLAGTTYHLRHTQIHRIVISEEPTATLLLRGPYKVDETSIFTTRPPYDDIDLPSLDVEALREDLEFVSERIT